MSDLEREVFDNWLVDNDAPLNNGLFGELVMGCMYEAWLGAKARYEAEPSMTATLEQTVCELTSCTPEEDYSDIWEGSCGATWTFFYGSPDDNDMRYCPRCGGGVVIPAKEAVTE